MGDLASESRGHQPIEGLDYCKFSIVGFMDGDMAQHGPSRYTRTRVRVDIYFPKGFEYNDHWISGDWMNETGVGVDANLQELLEYWTGVPITV
jgi:hypothetical protein